MKVFFLVRGLGEYAQAYAVAQYLYEANHELLFISDNEFVGEIIQTDNFDLQLFENLEEVKNTVEDLHGDALFLCNSHTTIRYALTRPKRIKKIFTLDSNWLFNNDLYPTKTYEWVDTHYVVFPKNYFLSNLQGNGGNFVIGSNFAKKIYTPGFVPVGIKVTEGEKINIRKNYNVTPDKKLITLYFSNPKVIQNDRFMHLKIKLLAGLKKILPQIEEELKVQIILVNLSTEAEMIKVKKTETYDRLIVSADLMIMHHGYGSLPKLFHNQVPIISFTESPENPSFGAYFELSPAIKSGAVRHFFYEKYTLEELKSAISSFLSDKNQIQKIKENQAKIFVDGEKNLIDNFYSHFH